jgi:hypothetical protein
MLESYHEESQKAVKKGSLRENLRCAFIWRPCFDSVLTSSPAYWPWIGSSGELEWIIDYSLLFREHWHQTDVNMAMEPTLDEAQKAIEQGDWGNFGKAMGALKRLLAGPVPER